MKDRASQNSYIQDVFIEKRMRCAKVVQAIECQAVNLDAAWREANEGLDPLGGDWIEVIKVDDPQEDLPL